MTKFSSPIVAATFGGMVALIASSARAQSPTQIAAQENDAGKQLMFERKYKEASAMFRSAAARSPDPKYYFNLCAAEYQQSVFHQQGALLQAWAACRTADKLSPDDVLKTKLAALEDKIKSDAASQRIDLEPARTDNGTTDGGNTSGDSSGGGTTGGSSGDGTGAPTGGGSSGGTTGGTTGGGGSGPAGGGSQTGTQAPPASSQGQPTQDLFVAAKPEHAYTWTIGVDLFGGRGQIGQDDSFGNVIGGARLKFDLLINPAAKLGSQFYFQGTGFSSGDQSLQLYDTGAALYRHFCGGTRLCFTPLAGAHLTVMNPYDDRVRSEVFSYLGFGARLEGRMSYSLGKRLEHVISVAIDAGWYTRALSEPMNGLAAENWGLDKGGNVVALNFGYTYRFNTPLGRVPFLSLE